MPAYSSGAAPTSPSSSGPSQNLTPVGAAPGPVALYNLKSGTIAANSTDAVNGAQVYAIGTGVANAFGGGSVALGGAALAARGASTGYAAFGLGAAQNSVGEIAIAHRPKRSTAGSFTPSSSRWRRTASGLPISPTA